MSTGRLTRQEIGWLLAQEARGAARVLRKDVGIFTRSSFPAPPSNRPEPEPTPEQAGDFETTLDALEDAIGMLSELQKAGPKPSRKGRIDVAALLCELSPTTNIALEPGQGTEVFGDEAELRRMLHVLSSQTNSAPGESTRMPVAIRREGDFVRITTELGPDASSTTEIERRWLSRMATKSGGRLELDGGTVSVLLPADASTEKSEVEDLRKELVQARELGATYARELAAVFAAGLPELAPQEDSRDVATRRFHLLLSCARALYRPLHAIFRSLEEDIGRLAPDKSASLRAHADLGMELATELGHIAHCPAAESLAEVDLSEAVQAAMEQAEGRAARHGVTFSAILPPKMTISSRRQALTLLFQSLVAQAVSATPKGGRIAVSIGEALGEIAIVFEDGGAVVPAASRADLLEHRVDPTSLGRPPGVALLVASVTAAHLGVRLSLTDSGVVLRFEPA